MAKSSGRKPISRLNGSRMASGSDQLPQASTLPEFARSLLDDCKVMQALGLNFSSALSTELRAFIMSAEGEFTDAPQCEQVNLHDFLLWLMQAKAGRGAEEDAPVAQITPYQYEALLAEFCRRGKISEKILKALAHAANPENESEAAAALHDLQSSPLVIDNAWIPLKLLGRGSYKAVYLCCEKGDHKNMRVVHVFAPQNQHDPHIETAAKQFHDEAIIQKLFKELEIAGLPQAESVKEEPLHYYVSEYREGAEPLDVVLQCLRDPSTEDSVAEKPADDRQSYQLFIQIIRSLVEAAKIGVLHRDVKSANILRFPTEHGSQAFVIDWGIARVVPGSEADFRLQESKSSTLVPEQGDGGTPRFMHPKDLGAFGNLQGASPVEFLAFSLAVTLHEWLTLKTPYQETTHNRDDLKKAYAEAGVENAGLPEFPKDVLVQGADGKRCAALYEVLKSFAAGAHGTEGDAVFAKLLQACERIDTEAARSTPDRYDDYRKFVWIRRAVKTFAAAFALTLGAVYDEPSLQQSEVPTHEAGNTSLPDPGWKAWHLYTGGDISNSVQSDTSLVDPLTPGTYSIRGEASGYFRTAYKDGLLRVVDTKPPVITAAEESISVDLDDPLPEPEATAHDAGAGNVPVRARNATSLKTDSPTFKNPLTMAIEASDGRGNTGHEEISVNVLPHQWRTCQAMPRTEGSVRVVHRWNSEVRPLDSLTTCTTGGYALQFSGAGDPVLNLLAYTNPASRFVTTSTGAAITRMPLAPEQVEAFRGHLRMPGHIRKQGETPQAQSGDEGRSAIFLSFPASQSTTADKDQNSPSRVVVVYIPGVGAVFLFPPDAGDPEDPQPYPGAARWHVCHSDAEVQELLNKHNHSIGEMNDVVHGGGGTINQKAPGFEKQLGMQQLPPEEAAAAIEAIMEDLQPILSASMRQ